MSADRIGGAASICSMPGCGRYAYVGVRWCPECYYPGIDEDFQRYQDLRADGYSAYQARVMSGLSDPDEAKRD